MHVITRNCVLFLWIHTLTFVKSQDCTLDQFLSSKLYDSNFDITNLEDSYSTGRQVRVSCNVGFSGFFKLICAGGQWQSKGTKCQPRSCGHPGDAQFADFHLVHGDDFVFGSKVAYVCHKGYQMISRTSFRNCLTEGWDGVIPVCEPQQCSVFEVDNNVQVNGDLEEATYGNAVRFTCKSNREILVGSAEIFCDENGKWSGPAPQCKEVKCTAPVIENGQVHGDIQEYKEHEVLQYTCNPKYKRIEERPSTCTKIGERAAWTPTPVCEPIRCKLTPALQGTRYDPAHRNVFSPGDTLRVTCGERYWISTRQDTSVVTTCGHDGKWTVRPVCYEVTCNRPTDRFVASWDVYRWPKITLDYSVGYECKRGYKSTDGNNLATCTRDEWTPKPFCQEITCDRPHIQNADVSIYKRTYKYNDRADFVCKDGYKGRPTRICGKDGWVGDSQCSEITCDRPRIQNADISIHKPTYKYNDRVDFVCKAGYEGSPTRICGKNGWVGDSQCSEITCDRPHIQNADISIYKRTYKYNDRADFVCKAGYEGSPTRICGKDGWVGDSQCSELTALTACSKDEAKVPHGFVVGPYNDSLYYTCDEDHKLLTKGWWGETKCDGQVWSGFGQCIEKIKCGEIPLISDGTITTQQNVFGENERVKITCKNGYEPQIDSLTCNQGNWDANGLSYESICALTDNHCKHPPKVTNAIVVTSYERIYGSGSEVIYQCRDKYEMEGENKIQCKNGDWEKKNIKCTAPTQEQ